MNSKKLTNHYRFRKIADKVIMTNEHGKWLSLSKEEFDKFQKYSAFLEQKNQNNNNSSSNKNNNKINNQEKIKNDNKSKELNKNKNNQNNIDNIISKELEEKLLNKGFIITKDNIEKIKSDYWIRNDFLHQGTSLHIIVVTLRCNQSCVYCHASARSPDKMEFDMTKKTAKKTIDFIFQASTDKITIEFQGGEPLLNFDTIKYATEYANELNKKYNKDLQIVMVTNLSLMTDKILNYCIENKIYLCTSLDGPEKLHNLNRPLKTGSYSKVTYWIRKIQEEYKKRNIDYTKINALVTISKESLKYPKEIIDEYISNNLYGVHLRNINKLGHAKNKNNLNDYSAEEFIKFWKLAIEHIIELNNKGTRFIERGALIILKKINENTDPNYLDMRSPCGAVIGQMAYNYDGKIFCCDEARTVDEDIFEIGDANTDKFTEVVISEKSASIISASINDGEICDLCAYKPFCGICPVCNYVEQGTTTGIIPKTSMCKISMAQFDYIFDKYINDKVARKVFDSWLKN